MNSDSSREFLNREHASGVMEPLASEQGRRERGRVPQAELAMLGSNKKSPPGSEDLVVFLARSPTSLRRWRREPVGLCLCWAGAC